MRSRHSATTTLCLLAVMVTACPGLLSKVLAQEVPFTGVVIQNQTDVRAGAADRYYRVGELDKGQLVRVDEVIAGWNKIVPPEGFCSYISKAFVDAKGDGSTGVVNTDRSKVYAADMNGPAGSYRVQAILNEGDGVQIIDEEGSHYKIAAPANAYVYLPPGSVRRALAMETAPAEPAEPEAAEPVEQPEVVEPEPVIEPEPAPEPEPVPAPVVVVPVEPAPEPVVETPAEPVAELTEIQPPAVTEPISEDTSAQALEDLLGHDQETGDPAPAVELFSLVELEAQVEAMREMPLEEQPLDQMIARYELLESKGGLSQPDAYRVASRLTTLRYNKRIAEGLTVIARARDTESAPETDPGPEIVTYNAVGQLLASSVYDGRTLPRMYRLVDPTTGRAVAYLRPAGPVDTTAFLGRFVGIQGTTAYDPALKLKVITVQKIGPLRPAD
jgi:hypothetical protein